MPTHSGQISLAALGIVGVCLASGLLATPGVVQLEGGRIVRGEIRAEPDAGLIVQPPSGPAVQVQFAELRHLKLGTEAPFPDRQLTSKSKSPRNPWESVNLGRLRPAGETIFRDESIVVRASGTNVWTGGRDECRFVFQKVNGDGSIVARLDQTDARWAGLMIRMGTGADSQFVMAALNARDGSLTFCARRSPEYREKFKVEGDYHQRAGLKAPLWIRLDRTGKKFIAYISRDDRDHWEQVAASRGRHTSEVCYGIFVSGGAAEECHEAIFSHVTITAAAGGRPEPSGNVNAQSDKSASESRLEQYVLLRNGSVLKGKILQIDPSGVRMDFLDREHFLSSVQVARVVWRPAPPGTGLLLPGRSGVLLTSGDFLEGELIAVRKNDLTINSVLLGQRKVEMSSKLVALVWNDLAPEPARFLVHLRCGSRLRAARLSSEEDAIFAHGATASALRLPIAALAEIRRE